MWGKSEKLNYLLEYIHISILLYRYFYITYEYIIDIFDSILRRLRLSRLYEPIYVIKGKNKCQYANATGARVKEVVSIRLTKSSRYSRPKCTLPKVTSARRKLIPFHAQYTAR